MMKTCVVLALFLMAGVSLGDIQKRVDNGRPCTADETEHFVFLRISNQVIRSNFSCSGTVIGNGNWILTAKHCKNDGGLGWLFRYFRKFNVKDVTSTLEITSKETFPHKTADVMLIKVNTGMAGMPLVPEAVCSQVMNQISPTNTVPMVVPARHTKEEDKTWKDVSMCADIKVNGRGTIRKTNVLLWSPDGCDTCKGDSGAGYIYNNALFAVHSGKIPVGQGKVENVGPIVCNGHIRNWIVNTMNNNP
ncbi:glandular kallikrein-like [Cololabis saira]|uniref:glandular kallikrein-like n=1 Tax=Cololabis saira TaxID=129043 RepID=UPI002AD45F77|nr:glandular kallikrein-like [Cololabis saira]